MPVPASAILLAAGSGARLGAGRPKALVEVAGRPLVCWSASVLARSARVSRCVVVVPAGRDGEAVARAVSDSGLAAITVVGGARRRDSVAAGLSRVETPLVAVHDAARPAAGEALFERVLEAAEFAGAAVPVVPVADSLVRIRDDRLADVVSRDEIRAVQTPQAFGADVLRRAHEQADPSWDAPDDGAMVARIGHPVRLVPGDPDNRKLTWEADRRWFELLLAGKGASR